MEVVSIERETGLMSYYVLRFKELPGINFGAYVFDKGYQKEQKALKKKFGQLRAYIDRD